MKTTNKLKSGITFAVVILFAVLTLIFATTGRADVVEFPLSCEGQYNALDTWSTNFDLGLSFTEVTNVYIDWSGTITAELVAPAISPEQTYPIDARFVAKLYESDPYDYFGRAYVEAGQETYPNPELFQTQSAFTDEDWSMLLDGQGNIEIWFGGIERWSDIITIEDPIGQLNSATLVIEGAIIPEPMSIILLAIGIAGVRLSECKTCLKFNSPRSIEERR